MTVTRRSARRGEPRRPLVLVVVIVSVAVLVAVSAHASPSNEPPARISVASVGLAGESTSFYCGGLEHVPGVVESDVAIADLSDAKRVVEVTTTDELGHVSQRQVAVRPGAVVHLSPANLIGGSLEAVSVVALDGGVAVTEAIRSVNGTAVAPCLTRAAPSWWLTGGSTKKGESFVLSVFNPYASTAVASVTLQTPSGVAVPQSLQGIVIKPHELAAVNLHAVAPNQSPITAHVMTNEGVVVVFAISRSTNGGSSISLLPAAPATSLSLAFPIGNSASDRTTKLLLAAPGGAAVNADVRVLAPPRCKQLCPAPFLITIPSEGFYPVTVSPSTRVPADKEMASDVTATGAGVIGVQRVSEAGSSGQSAPIDDPTMSGPETLVLVNPLASGFDDVGLLNPTSHAVHVTLATVGPRGQRTIGSTYTVPAHQSYVLSPGAFRGMVDGVLLLLSDGPLRGAADVHGALLGSGVLVAVPTR